MTRFRPNPRFAEQMARETAPYIQRRTRDALTTAKAGARVVTGRYRDSIQVDNEPDGATLFTDSPYGHIREWGDADNTADRTLTNAALDEADRVDVK